MKLGVLLAGRRPDDIGKRLEQAREAGFSLCQLNFMQSGLGRADLLGVADALLEFGMRPAAIGCYVNPLRPDEPSFMGTCRDDLDLILHNLEVIGARRVVFWSGTHADSLYDDHPQNAEEHSLDMLRDFLWDVVEKTRARHYFLVIEPWRSHVLRNERRLAQFHDSLEPMVAERVRYVMDAPNLLTHEHYGERDKRAIQICRTVGSYAGLVHLKDCVMPPDGEESLPGPGQGRLDYNSYVKAIFENAPPDAPAVVKGVSPPEYAAARDYLLQLSDRWELA